jgi:hypothetical protein
MLEQPLLLIHAWRQTTLANGESAWIRAVADANGKRLGFVRFVGDPKGSWFSWLRKVRLDLYETDDASHLFSLKRSWSMLRIWEVDDADDRHVGTVYTKTIVSSEGDRLGYLDRETAEHGRILDRTGQVLLRYVTKTGDDVELAFVKEGTTNPFLRMLMLGCVLTLDAVPK